jgi:hypothetical protein
LSLHILDVLDISALNMPGLVRKILIFAAVDGLILQPLAQRGQKPATATKITYKDSHVGLSKGGEDDEKAAKSFEAFGIVGMGFSAKFGSRLDNKLTFYRSVDGLQILLPNLYYEAPAGCTDTRQSYLYDYGSCAHASSLEERS